MSVLSPKRVILFVAAALFAVPLFANHPSPRLQPRMAFDEQNGNAVLFGGVSIADSATGLTWASDQTWLWVKDQWIQQFPATRPPARSFHAMTYDSKRHRVLMFGGRKQATEPQGKNSMYGDFWSWQDGDWQQIDTATKPAERESPGLAYDRERDVVILFGGYNFAADGKTVQTLKDTWEFDGNDWHEVSNSGPESTKPLLVFDRERHETIMLGVKAADATTLMYRYVPETATWQSVTPATLPTCVNDAGFVYETSNQKLLAVGGICTSATPLLDETWEWDGDTWTKITTTAVTRSTGAAVAYDTANQNLIRYGGSTTFGSVVESSTTVLKGGTWRYLSTAGDVSTYATPNPRSYAMFRRDPVRGVIWMYGGLSEFSLSNDTIVYRTDFWRYFEGQWNRASGSTTVFPSNGCETPLSTFDKDRGVLQLLCQGNEIFEWDGTEWKAKTVTTTPDVRRFAGWVYDETLKKTVLFGGYDGVGNFRDDTWTWDGTTWNNVKVKTKPPNRAQMAMWYDPLAKKTMFFSGVGRENIDEHVTRFNDMWSFDGTTWTKMTVTETPGIRFGAQVAIDPNTGKVLLFGGLRAIVSEENSNDITQFYANDLWVWDGAQSKWTELHAATGTLPDPRQNASFEYDPSTGKFVLFGGFAGNFYYSDTWLWDGTNWTVVPNSPTVHRRRNTRP